MNIGSIFKTVFSSSYLIVRYLHSLESDQGQFEGTERVAAVLHVSGDSEQLRGGHGLGRALDDDLVGGLEGDGLALAKRQGVQTAVWRVLRKRSI